MSSRIRKLPRRLSYSTEDSNLENETSNAEASSSANGNDDVITDTSVSWPLNRQEGKSSVAGEGHCHVFPKSGHKKDAVTGEWTKSCACGLTLPFEKM